MAVAKVGALMEKGGNNGNGQTPRPPWRDKTGDLFPNWKIKRLSKRWNFKSWYSFLGDIQTPLKGRVGRKHDFAQLLSVTAFKKKGESFNSHLPTPVTYHPYDQPPEDFIKENPIDLAVRSSIEKLSPQEKVVIESTAFLGKSEARVAKELGVTRSTIQTVKRRAKQKLKSLLSSILPIDGG